MDDEFGNESLDTSSDVDMGSEIETLGEINSSDIDLDTSDDISSDVDTDTTDDMSLESDDATFDGYDASLDEDTSSDDMTLEADNLIRESVLETDYFENTARISEILTDFKGENWERLSLDDQKETVNRLADFNADILGIENKPRIEYYNNEDNGDFGGFSEQDNTMYINEYNMGDSIETADTIAHEYRHVFQQQRSLNPIFEQDYQFRENFDNPISASRDYAAYHDQIVESDARSYAQSFKDYINRS